MLKLDTWKRKLSSWCYKDFNGLRWQRTWLFRIWNIHFHEGQKSQHQWRISYENHCSTAPLEITDIDFLHLVTCTGSYGYILIITHNFTRFTQGYPRANKSSRIVADKLYNGFIEQLITNKKTLSDMSKESKNKSFSRQSIPCSIKKFRTTPYHLQRSGLVEWMNQTVLSIFRYLLEQHKTNWRHHVNPIQYTTFRCCSQMGGEKFLRL